MPEIPSGQFLSALNPAMAGTLFDDISAALYDPGFFIAHNCFDVKWIQAAASEARIACQKPAEVGRDPQGGTTTVRTDTIGWIEPQSAASCAWLDFTAQLQQALNQRLFLGLFQFESHYAHYAPGAYYQRHWDAFRGDSNRKVSVVTYLNPDWATHEGGELQLYRNSEDTVGIRVSPTAGTLVVFLSEDHPHEVLAATRDRFSIAGWFRVNGTHRHRLDPPA